MEEFDQYIPPLWVMCLESVAHLLVMLNFSTNFLIYCSVSSPFKKALSKACWLCWGSPSTSSPGIQLTEATVVQDKVRTHPTLQP